MRCDTCDIYQASKIVTAMERISKFEGQQQIHNTQLRHDQCFEGWFWGPPGFAGHQQKLCWFWETRKATRNGFGDFVRPRKSPRVRVVVPLALQGPKVSCLGLE